MDWTAIALTLKLAACTTATLFVLGVPIARWLAESRSRAKFVVEAIVALPLVLPPTVLGFYLLYSLGPRSTLGGAYQSFTGAPLPFSFTGIWLASVIFNLPFSVRPFAAGFASVDPRLSEISWTLGVSRFNTFWRVVLPLAWPQVVAGLILTFAHTVGEFGVVLMVGGNIPGLTRTLSVVIYDDVQALDYAAAGRTSLALLIFSFVVLCCTSALERRRVR